jgi:hypothetical protein
MQSEHAARSLFSGLNSVPDRCRNDARLAGRFGFDHATVEVCAAGAEGDARLPAAGCSPI